MDRDARYRVVNRQVGKGVSALLLLAFLLVGTGCNRYEGGAAPPMPFPAPGARAFDNAVPVPIPEELPPVPAAGGAGEAARTSPADNAAADSADADGDATGATVTGSAGLGGPEAVAPAASPPQEAKVESDVPPPRDAALPAATPSAHKPKEAATAHPVPTAPPKEAAATHPFPTAPPKETNGPSVPEWSKGREELVYRIDFVGITMGYARFRYQGKVSIAGKLAYHLNVRAWTSGVLSLVYPINDTIEYYLDAETLAPIRQEFTRRESEKDDVALYDQESGRITYRYRQSGKIRKQVTTVPAVYDPVSVAYYFRWKDLGVENRPRNMYGGRKLYQISSRILGNERIRTERGEVDTIAVVPVIRRDGKPDNKGDLKIWFSNDERRVPVRVYAKFRKIKEWTLVGELVPSAGKAGG
jgi:hypothetical protein